MCEGDDLVQERSSDWLRRNHQDADGLVYEADFCAMVGELDLMGICERLWHIDMQYTSVSRYHKPEHNSFSFYERTRM
jgi:hypothetical protein